MPYFLKKKIYTVIFGIARTQNLFLVAERENNPPSRVHPSPILLTNFFQNSKTTIDSSNLKKKPKICNLRKRRSVRKKNYYSKVSTTFPSWVSLYTVFPCLMSFSTQKPHSNKLRCHSRPALSNPVLDWRHSMVVQPSFIALRIFLLTGLLMALR